MPTGTIKGSTPELVVLWQQPATRAMIPVATLTFDGAVYRFEYLSAAQTTAGFRPLIGFKDFDGHYESVDLFPLFRERIMDPARDDFEAVLEGLHLDPATATPWEQLVHSGGSSEGDTLQVAPLPRPHEEGWSCTTLASGLRYLQVKSVETSLGTSPIYSEAGFEAVLEGLVPGEVLTLRPEIGNAYSSDAVLIFTNRDEPLGYLPDWLARFMSPVLADAGHWPTARVERVNPPAASWHLRLVVSVQVTEPYATASIRLRSGAALNY